MGVGIMLHRFGTVDEYELRGRGRELPGVAAGMFVVGGLVLAAAPMLGTFFGKSLIDESALTHGYWWLPAVLVIAAAVTGGAVLRAAGRVFGGYGPAEPHPAAPQEHEGVETVTERDHTPATMLAPAAVLTACAVVVGLVPGVVHAIEHASQRFMERGAYAATVLHGAHPRVPTAPPSSLHASDFIYASLSLTLALALAWAALSREPLSRHAPRALMHGGRRALAALRALHSGHVGDYVAWLTFAVATLGGLFALTLR
jgi:multicomponent Na+:H+ antiporter subunit D